MTLAAAIFAAALTRAEIIDRFRAPPVTNTGGLVQTVADCPADMREEFLLPVARFASDICRKLYISAGPHPQPRFPEPGIVIHIGDMRTPVTNVASVVSSRGGRKFTKIFIPSPAFADKELLAVEIARAFALAVLDRKIGRAEAEDLLVAADPAASADREYAKIGRWQNGEEGAADDEEMLDLCRKVIEPGRARVQDVLRFASRLYLYPEAFDSPFCGRYPQCDFAQAIKFAGKDARIRFAAYAKAPPLVALAAGRGDELLEAARAYGDLLFELARFKKTEDELFKMLEDADAKLNIAMEKARLEESREDAE